MTSNIFNEDFKDFIQALNTCDVEYILVGGYSVILHGYSRTTGDMDIWVKPSLENYKKLVLAFNQFGMSIFDMTASKFLAIGHYDVFTFGRPPVCIEILTMVKGLVFEDAFSLAQWFGVTTDISVRTLYLPHLIDAKKAANRPKDIDDIENLLQE